MRQGTERFYANPEEELLVPMARLSAGRKVGTEAGTTHLRTLLVFDVGQLGDIIAAVEAAAPEATVVPLSDVLLGRHPGRRGSAAPGAAGPRDDQELIVCDLTGCGAQDAAIGAMVWRRMTAEVDGDSGAPASRL